jgi:hypothetical protein
VRQKSRYF